jgi:hypothetical protein
LAGRDSRGCPEDTSRALLLDAKTALELAGSGPPTLVLVDRRQTERRCVATAVCPDHRQDDRQTVPPASWRRGFMLRWRAGVPGTGPEIDRRPVEPSTRPPATRLA